MSDLLRRRKGIWQVRGSILLKDVVGSIPVTLVGWSMTQEHFVTHKNDGQESRDGNISAEPDGQPSGEKAGRAMDNAEIPFKPKAPHISK